MTMNMVLPGQVLAALRSAGVYPDGVSIGDATDKATWRVQPESMMGAAAPVFVAFDTDAANTAQQWYVVRTERKLRTPRSPTRMRLRGGRIAPPFGRCRKCRQTPTRLSGRRRPLS